MNPDKRKTSKCRQCGILFKYGKGKMGYYCSNSCCAKYRKNTTIENWLNSNGTKYGNMKCSGRLKHSIRDFLIEKANHKCSSCGWCEINPVTNKCPLEIDHIDGNSENSSPKNLRVLCPNCHALTPTYKALNYGKGSKKRLKYSKLI